MSFALNVFLCSSINLYKGYFISIGRSEINKYWWSLILKYSNIIFSDDNDPPKMTISPEDVDQTTLPPIIEDDGK